MVTPAWEISKRLQEECEFTVDGKKCFYRPSTYSVFVGYGNRKYEYSNPPQAIHAKVFGGKSMFELWEQISPQL
ncbi:MAG: hypothetical protein IKF60_08295 [Solobacterium sp.]|nr:hypothetical protein [Solobacterium sp.]MBR3345726.1 hypothetical protein [Solobacterium sp.]